MIVFCYVFSVNYKTPENKKEQSQLVFILCLHPKHLDNQLKKGGVGLSISLHFLSLPQFNSIKTPHFQFHLLHAPIKGEGNLRHFHFSYVKL